MIVIRPKINSTAVVNMERKSLTSNCPSQKHAGRLVESIIRKQGHNISQLARYMKISRCTLYHWFEHDNLPFEILVRIGSCINYDFSSDFPEVFSLNPKTRSERNSLQDPYVENENVDYWMKKYILLLEKYNECLLSQRKTQNTDNQTLTTPPLP